MNVEVKSKDGFTPIHWACHWVQPACLKLLIDKGGNVKATTKHDKTPLQFSKGDHEIVQLLSDAGVDVSKPDWLWPGMQF